MSFRQQGPFGKISQITFILNQLPYIFFHKDEGFFFKLLNQREDSYVLLFCMKQERWGNIYISQGKQRQPENGLW